MFTELPEDIKNELVAATKRGLHFEAVSVTETKDTIEIVFDASFSFQAPMIHRLIALSTQYVLDGEECDDKPWILAVYKK